MPDLVKILREMDAVARKGIILQQLKQAGVLDATALQLPAEMARWAEGRRWVCDLDTYQCTEVEPETTSFPGELLSPDGRWAAFVKGNNLYVHSIDTGKEIALTCDGEPYYNYATSPESNTHTVTDRLAGRPLPPVAIWSPDSSTSCNRRHRTGACARFCIRIVIPCLEMRTWRPLNLSFWTLRLRQNRSSNTNPSLFFFFLP
jgi:hypothetical protein